ncbi:MAG: hypothetical protein KJO75_13130 [Dactylosporangium sp.]|nr:hypothetical protein [Dactylosporangium sp.]
MKGVVQLALVFLRQERRIDGAPGKEIEQGRVASTLVRGLFVECGKAAGGRAAFGRDLGEPPL